MKKMLKILGIIILIPVVLIVLVIIIGLLFLRFYPSVGDHPTDVEKKVYETKSALYSDGEFHNEQQSSLMSGESYPSDPRRVPEQMIKADKPDLLTEPEDADLTFTWLGHASFLLQVGSKTILADPVLSERSSPVGFAGPKRFSEIPISSEEMPDIDILLISHDHYDHLDYQTILELKGKVSHFVVPLGVDTILKGWGVEAERIIPMSWWEETEIDGITVTMTPSQHFTGRDPLKRNSTLWGGYYIDNGYHKIYYTGDGGYCDVFSQVKEKLGAPEIMIAECGQYDPSWATVHMFPEETVQAYFDAGAEYLIPVHGGTFCICNHAWDDSIIRATNEAAGTGAVIITPRIGQTVKGSDITSFTEKWWEEYNDDKISG